MEMSNDEQKIHDMLNDFKGRLREIEKRLDEFHRASDEDIQQVLDRLDRLEQSPIMRLMEKVKRLDLSKTPTADIDLPGQVEFDEKGKMTFIEPTAEPEFVAKNGPPEFQAKNSLPTAEGDE